MRHDCVDRTSGAHDCVYATSGWGIHDDRWLTALLEVGFTPQVLSLGRDAADTSDLRRLVAAAADGGLPVLAGPLHTVTRGLLGLDLRLVALSWGYDLSDLDVAGADLSWLAGLGGVIVDSQANLQIALLAGVTADRITFLPWGVDLSTFTIRPGSTVAPDLGVPDDAHLVLSLRAHEPIYRVGDIVEAFARARRADDVYLIIGNGGSLTGRLTERVSDLGIVERTRFIGSVPESDLVPLLSHASSYVTASEVDGTSVTLLQAMACGTPVIASATPGNLGWIDDGRTGRTFPTGDVDALARLIERTSDPRPTDQVRWARELVEREADWHANLPRLRAAMERA